MEFCGEPNFNNNSPILYGTILCSCGWSICVTIILTLLSDYKEINREENGGIAETILCLFTSHKPTLSQDIMFISTKNKVSGTALGSDHPMS